MNISSSPSFPSLRKPAVAGSFYSGDAKVLAATVDDLVGKAEAVKPTEQLAALIVPHAGYIYSGQVAAHAYRQLEGREYDTVVLIGASHRKSFSGIAAADFDGFETPLGTVPVDKKMISSLKALDKDIILDSGAHEGDHVLEVQIPFLQRTLKNFKIVPLLFGSLDPREIVGLAKAIAAVSDDKTLVVASTDWSHYYNYDKAVKLDKEGIKAVLENDPEKLLSCLVEKKAEACSSPAIVTAMLYAQDKGAADIELLKYANSGDVTGDKTNVVGYAAIAFYRNVTPLSEQDKKTLLKLARTTLENHYLGTNRAVDASSPALQRKSGAFVTLEKEGRLRGCIGTIPAVEPLNKTVEKMALAAALEDNRFPPVTKDELAKLHIEISVLSPMKRIKDVSEIMVGRDGLLLIARGRSGVFLPQVPGEFGWDRDEYLRQICGKAGLPDGAWKDKDAQLYTFTAQVFGE